MAGLTSAEFPSHLRDQFEESIVVASTVRNDQRIWVLPAGTYQIPSFPTSPRTADTAVLMRQVSLRHTVARFSESPDTWIGRTVVLLKRIGQRRWGAFDSQGTQYTVVEREVNEERCPEVVLAPLFEQMSAVVKTTHVAHETKTFLIRYIPPELSFKELKVQKYHYRFQLWLMSQVVKIVSDMHRVGLVLREIQFKDFFWDDRDVLFMPTDRVCFAAAKEAVSKRFNKTFPDHKELPHVEKAKLLDLWVLAKFLSVWITGKKADMIDDYTIDKVYACIQETSFAFLAPLIVELFEGTTTLEKLARIMDNPDAEPDHSACDLSNIDAKQCWSTSGVDGDRQASEEEAEDE